MAKIDIDYNSVKNTNYALPSLRSSLSGIKRDVSMLRWRITEEVMDEREIRIRLDNAISEMESIEDSLGDIYRVIGDSVSQYMNLETRLNEKAAKFRGERG